MQRFSSPSAGICPCSRCGSRRRGSTPARSGSCWRRSSSRASSARRSGRACPTAMARRRAASSPARWRRSWRWSCSAARRGFAAILAAAILYALTTSPIMPLIDAYALKGLSQRALPYGPVRLWGSVAFIVATLTGGVLLGFIARTDLIWLIFAGSCLVAAATLALVPASARRERRGARERAQPSAPAGVPRHRGGGLPDPGEPRGLLRLLDARLERQGFWRRHHRRAVGARRRGRDRAVRVRAAPAEVDRTGDADPDRRGRRRSCAGSRPRSIRRWRCSRRCRCCTRCRSARRISAR